MRKINLNLKLQVAAEIKIFCPKNSEHFINR
jgi:hypothetical protein